MKFVSGFRSRIFISFLSCRPVSCGDLYYITGKPCVCQHQIYDFLKKICDYPKMPAIRKKHRFRGAILHMAGVAGLEPTHAGFRDPCLTNLAIPLCRQHFAVNKRYYSLFPALWQVLFLFFTEQMENLKVKQETKRSLVSSQTIDYVII